jgi:phospholipid transport system substrate-binding protein
MGQGITRRTVLLTTLVAAALSFVRLPAAVAQPGSVPEQPVRDLYAALQVAMRAGRATPFPNRFASLSPVIDRVFDLETVLKVSVGPRWNGLDPATQDRLMLAFRRFTVATYVASFDKYEGEQFVVRPGAREAGVDRVVQTAIAADNGDSMRLDYVMRPSDGIWRAVDVLIDGSISRVAVQRSDFRTILAGGDAEALIKSLHRKVSDLSNGALST